MKLQQLRYFQVICKYNNLTKAANELHISQPSLSNAVRELEEEFDTPLFYRLSKGLLLTEEGEFFLQESTRLLDQADRLAAQMYSLSANQTVKLGVSPMITSLIFPHLLQTFRDSFPNTQLQLLENGTITNKSMVLNGMLDAAIISSSDSLPSTFKYHNLAALKICFYASRDNPLADRSSIALTDVGELPLILLAEDSFLTTYLNQRFKDLKLSPHVILHSNQLTAIQQLVSSGTAATFLFDGVLDHVPELVKIPVDHLSTIMIRLIWSAGRRLSSGTQNLVRLAKSNYKLDASCSELSSL